MKIEPETHAPPVVRVRLERRSSPAATSSAAVGNQRRTDFQCVVESVKQKFTLFSPEGVPLRAMLTVTLREYKTLDEQLQQLNLSSPDRTQSHVVPQRRDAGGIAGRRYYAGPASGGAIAPTTTTSTTRAGSTPGRFLRVPPHRG